MPIHPEVMKLTRRVRTLEKQVLRHKQPGLSYSSIEDGALQSVDDGTLRMIIGSQYDGTQGAVNVNGPPPPQPAVPLVTERDAGLAIYWDGTFANPADVAPMDFVRVTVHATPLADFTTLNPLDQTRIVGSITEATGGERFASLTPGVEHIVHLVCWSASGKFSLPSDGATGTPNDLGAAVQADLDAVNASIAAGDSANATSIDNAINDYNSKFSAEALARANADTANSNAINQAISDFNAGLATKSKHTLSSAAPTVNDANNSGDVWERKDGTGAIIGRWRGGGGTSGAYVWTSMPLSATYIPQLDIGTGTFGDLSGTRLLVNSVGTEKLVIADFSNLVKDPQFKGIGTWSVSNGSFTIGQSVSVGPSGGAETVARTTATAGRVDQIIESQGTTVVPGQEYYLGAYARYQTVAPTAGTFYAGIIWKDASGATISTTYVVQQAATSLTSTWQKFEGSVIAPQGAATCTPLVRLSSTWNTGPLVDFGQMTVRRKHGGELVVDGTIKTNNLAVDAVDATVVKAGTLGVRELVVTNFDNLVGDPRFSKPLGDPNGWSSSGGAAELSIVPNSNSTSDGPTLTAGPGATARFPVWGSAALLWDVEPGSAFRVRSRFFTTAAEAANIVGISMRWFATDGTFVDTSAMYSIISTAGAWQEVSGTLKCPTTAGKTYHKAYIFLRIGARTGTIRFEQVSATRAGDGNLIVDGAIQAKHITADMVSGLLLSGRVIQTNQTANRGIKISDSGLVGYNNSGVVTTLIDPTTGRITAAGSFSTAIGQDDIEVRPGDGLSVTAAMRFINASGSRYRNTDPATLSLQTMGSANGWILTLQGAMSTESTNRPRIDITTDNTTSGTTTSYITSSASLYHRFDINTSMIATIESTGIITPTGKGFFDQTYLNAGGATCIINNNGRFTKSGSLRRLKRNIQDMSLEQARTLYELRPTTGQWIEEQEMGDHVWPFFIAEEVAETSGGNIWAAYNDDGQVTGVHYAEITVGLVALVRDLNDRIQRLESAA